MAFPFTTDNRLLAGCWESYDPEELRRKFLNSLGRSDRRRAAKILDQFDQFSERRRTEAAAAVIAREVGHTPDLGLTDFYAIMCEPTADLSERLCALEIIVRCEPHADIERLMKFAGLAG